MGSTKAEKKDNRVLANIKKTFLLKFLFLFLLTFFYDDHNLMIGGQIGTIFYRNKPNNKYLNSKSIFLYLLYVY